MDVNAKWTNRGTVTVKTDVNRTLYVSSPGWAYNFSRIELTAGNLLFRRLVNAGEFKVNQGTQVKIGADPAVPNASASLWLDSTASALSPATSAFIGAGKLHLTKDASVTAYAGTAYVANVDDYSQGTTGAGNLIITGTYTWGRPDPNQRESGAWTGPGFTQVGSDDERSAKLVLAAVIHSTSRPLVCYGRIEWKSDTIAATIPNPLPPAPGGGMFDWKALTFSTRGVEIKPRQNVASTVWPTFEIDSKGDFTQAMIGDIKNSGRVQATTDKLIEITGAYKDVNGGKLNVERRTGKGKVKVNGETQLSAGTIDIGNGATLALLAALIQSGGGLTNAGELDVTGGFTLAGGTVTSQGNGTDPAMVTIDTLVQSGGDVTTAGTWTVSGPYTLSGGTMTAQPGLSFPATVTADSLAQSGGTVTSTTPWTITNAFALSGGTFTQGGTSGPSAPLSAGSLTQTNGDFWFAAPGVDSPFSVVGDYVFQGGTADVTEPMGSQVPGGNLGRLVVQAGNITFRGKFAAPGGIEVTPTGALVVNQADVTANILVHGFLHLAYASVLTGNLVNAATVHMSFPEVVSPMDQLVINGNFTQQSGARLIMDIAGYGSGSGGCDLITVSGTATLAGTLEIRTPPNSYYGGVFRLMSYQSRSGMFDSLVQPSGGPTLEAWYDNPFSNSMGVRQVMMMPPPGP